MAKMQCNTCGGVYDTVAADGGSYFHACAPLLAVAVERAGTAQFVAVTDLQPTDIVSVQRAGKVTPVAVADMLPDDQRLGDRLVERSDARDENPIRVIVNGKPESLPRKEGKGASPAPVIQPAPVVVVADAL